MRPGLKTIIVVSIVAIFAGSVGLLWLYSSFQKPFNAFHWLQAGIFWLSASLIIIGIMFFILPLCNASSELFKKGLLSACSIFFVVLLVESGLRIADINSTYMEIRGQKYISPYIRKDHNVLRTYGPGTTTFLESPEYKYPRHHNSHGFSDDEFHPKTEPGQVLIQTYGDSFTEGDGAPADSSYPALLRQMLRSGGSSDIIIQNFGICGNDPGFYWRQLKDIGLHFQPDVVVIMYGTYDLNTDFFSRGGLERFKGDYWQGYHPPTWEWIYASSYVSRIFIHYYADVKSEYFLTNEFERAERLRSLESVWNETFMEIADLTCSRNVKVMLVKKPERSEVDLNSYSADFGFFEKMVDSVGCFEKFDLLTYYRDSAGMDQSNSGHYYWKQDGHHNSVGYEVMARGVLAALKSNFPDLLMSNREDAAAGLQSDI